MTFSSNSVNRKGSALYSSDNSHITFTGNAKVTFINNKVEVRGYYAYAYQGGTIYSEHSYISFEGNSITL